MEAERRDTTLAISDFHGPPLRAPRMLPSCRALIGVGYLDPNAPCRFGVSPETVNTQFHIRVAELFRFLKNRHTVVPMKATYSYSKTLVNVSEIFFTFAAREANSFAQNPLQTGQGEYGMSGWDFPNTFILSV